MKISNKDIQLEQVQSYRKTPIKGSTLATGNNSKVIELNIYGPVMTYGNEQIDTPSNLIQDCECQDNRISINFEVVHYNNLFEEREDRFYIPMIKMYLKNSNEPININVTWRFHNMDGSAGPPERKLAILNDSLVYRIGG